MGRGKCGEEGGGGGGEGEGRGENSRPHNVVGSRLCSGRFFSVYSDFPFSSKTNISKFQYDQKC